MSGGRPRFSRRGGATGGGAATRTTGRARERTGVPRYLGAQGGEHAEHEAAAATRAWRAGASAGQLSRIPGPGSQAAETIAERAGSGRQLDATWRSRAASRYGLDADAVRIHDDPAAADLTSRLGANAVTVGRDVFFAAGRYAPDSAEGERILAHELAHVAQQEGEPRAVQCDLGMTLGVPLGAFDVNLVAQPSGPGQSPGMMGTIGFDPDPNGPYSAEIGLVQAVNVTDVGGTTASAGDPLDWSNVPGGHPEGDRMELMTDGSGVAPEGWFIDSRTANNARGSSIGPNYIEHFISPEPVNQFGYLRSPTDVRRASLWDFPQAPFDVDFDFETVAKGTDNQTVYGSVFWGFGIRSGAVEPTSEYAFAQGDASDTFEEALERYRGFFVHEPVVIYFDTNQDTPVAGEEGKLAGVPDYLERYPDVTVSIDGWADLRGGEDANAQLAQRRADSVQALLEGMGVDRSRIVWSFGMGETDSFSQHGAPSAERQAREAGLLRANRRAVVSFQHTVSGHPIVMP